MQRQELKEIDYQNAIGACPRCGLKIIKKEKQHECIEALRGVIAGLETVISRLEERGKERNVCRKNGEN